MFDTLKSYLLLFSLFLTASGLFAQGYNFVGNSSSIGGDCFILTPAQEWQNGAIWYNEAIDVSEPFNLQFTASFGSNDAGADGMVFVMQQVGNEVIGISGGGMGFEGFAPSLGVEFDTYQNLDFNDPTYDHVAISKNGNAIHGTPNSLADPVQISPASDNVEDGQSYIIDISWNPATSIFSVSVNCEVRIELGISLEFAVFPNTSNVYWGFTGATGGLFNEQRICLDPLILGLPESYDACQNVPVQLGAPAASFGTVSWEPAEFLDDPTSFNPIATVDETTTFTLTFEDLCGNQQIQQTTLVVSEPSVDLGPDFSECTNESVSLNASGEFDEIIWFDSSDQPTVSVSASGEYWAEVTQGGCQAFDTILVEINPFPEYNGDLLAELCEGEEFTFELGSSDSEIVWFDGADDEIRTFDESGNYSFDLSNSGCSSEFTLEVDVTETPDFDLGPDIGVCDEQQYTLIPNGDFETINWFDGSNSPSIQVVSSGTYWADFTQGNCEGADTVEVQFDSAPTYSGATDINLCGGEEFIFDLGGINAEIIWFDGGNEEIRTFDNSGSFGFQLVSGECTSDYELEIDVTPIPVFELGSDLTICAGDPILISQSGSALNLTWNNGSQGPTLEVDQGGLYWATANDNNCVFSDTVLVSTYPAPSLSVTGSESLCPDEEGFLIAETDDDVLWSTGEETNQISIDNPGNYIAVATNNDGCTREVFFTVDALRLPQINLVEDILKCQDKKFDLQIQSSNNFDLLWSDGTQGNRIQITDAGIYSVELTNECGVARREFLVEEEECFNSFFLPNAFTPDGDGLNDLYKAVIGGFVDFELLIFNRNGTLVFETNDPDQGWNGSFLNNGYYCEAGVYNVRFTIDFGNNEIVQEFGSVTLIR